MQITRATLSDMKNIFSMIIKTWDEVDQRLMVLLEILHVVGSGRQPSPPGIAWKPAFGERNYPGAFHAQKPYRILPHLSAL